MVIMIQLVLQYVSFLISTLVIIFILGTSIISFFKSIKNTLFRVFITTILGVFVLILFYSFFKSQAKTVMILSLPILLFLFLFVRSFLQKPTFEIKTLVKDLSLIIIASFIIFLFQIYYNFDFQTQLFKPINRDSFFYAAVSDSLKLWGTENFFPAMSYFFPGKIGLMPYHYPELWLTAFISQLFNCSSVNAYLFILAPIINGIFLVGISSLFERKTSNPMILFPISFILLGITGLFFPMYSHMGSLFELWWHSNVSVIGFSGIKFSFSYIIVLLGFILLTNKKTLIGLVVLLLVPIISVGMLPGICGGLFFLLISNFYIKVFEIQKKETFWILGILVLEVVGFYVFYSIMGQTYTNSYASNQIYSIFASNSANIFLSLKYFAGNIGSYFFKILLFYFPFLIPLILINRWNKTNWFFAALMLLCAAFTTTVTHELTDSIQFTSNIGVVFVCLILIDFASAVSLFNKKTSYFSYCCLICLTFLFLYSAQKSIGEKDLYIVEEGNPEFIARVSNLVSQKPAPILVFYNKEYYQNSISIRSAYSFFDKELIQIHQLKNIPLITPAGNIDLYKRYNYMNYADSFYYSQFSPLIVWQQIDSSHTLETFIKHFNIRYFYIMQGVDIPASITTLHTKEIISKSTQAKFIYRTER